MVADPRAATPPRLRPLCAAVRHVTLLLAALGGFPAAAQTPQELLDGLQQFAARVDAAHRTDTRGRPIESFRADLSLYQLAADARQRVEVELSVRYLEWHDGDRVVPLIRYKLIDSARSVEQGRDRVDYWGLMDGKVQDLRSKDLETDLAECRRNLKLARQMTRFLDPGAVLRGLAQPGPVQSEALQLGREPPIPCRTISGNLAAFPLRSQAGEDAPVRAKVWVGAQGKEEGRLLGLEVTPLAAGKPVPGQGEFLYFTDHQLLAGRLVPMRIEHFAVSAAGERKAQMRVTLTTLELNPPLKPQDFDRPSQ